MRKGEARREGLQVQQDANAIAKLAAKSVNGSCCGCGAPVGTTADETCVVAHCHLCGTHSCNCCYKYGTSNSVTAHNHVALCFMNTRLGSYWSYDKDLSEGSLGAGAGLRRRVRAPAAAARAQSKRHASTTRGGCG